jgi:hypothetical protein
VGAIKNGVNGFVHLGNFLQSIKKLLVGNFLLEICPSLEIRRMFGVSEKLKKKGSEEIEKERDGYP